MDPKRLPDLPLLPASVRRCLTPVALGASLLCASPSAARAEDAAKASELGDRAAVEASQGRRRAAIDLYEQAYAAAPRPHLLREIAAQYEALAAARDPRDVRLAILYYEKYLDDGGAGGADRADVEARLALLRALRAKAPPPAPVVAVRVEGGALWLGPGAWTQAWTLPGSGPVTHLMVRERCGGGHEVTFLQGGIPYRGEIYGGRRAGRLAMADPARSWDTSCAGAQADGPMRRNSPALANAGIAFIVIGAAQVIGGAIMLSQANGEYFGYFFGGIPLVVNGAGFLAAGIPMLIVGRKEVPVSGPPVPALAPLVVPPLGSAPSPPGRMPVGVALVGRF